MVSYPPFFSRRGSQQASGKPFYSVSAVLNTEAGCVTKAVGNDNFWLDTESAEC